jgi:hypothetical protein
MIRRSHGGGYEEFSLLEYNAVKSFESRRRFRKNISLSFSWLGVEMRYSSEALIEFQQTTRRYNPRERKLHFQICSMPISTPDISDPWVYTQTFLRGWTTEFASKGSYIPLKTISPFPLLTRWNFHSTEDTKITDLAKNICCAVSNLMDFCYL